LISVPTRYHTSNQQWHNRNRYQHRNCWLVSSSCPTPYEINFVFASMKPCCKASSFAYNDIDGKTQQLTWLRSLHCLFMEWKFGFCIIVKHFWFYATDETKLRSSPDGRTLSSVIMAVRTPLSWVEISYLFFMTLWGIAFFVVYKTCFYKSL
jgi:hypothetical protein